MASATALPSSFRDPSGFLFRRDGVLYRQVNRVYQPHYDRLMESGLYADLVERGLLVPHEEVEGGGGEAYKVLRPEPVPFISYPYEWSFRQLQDAALTTLRVQRRALKLGLTLKDASAYNIQFLQGRPVLIDTLSFELYQEGQPWVAYRQFCQHFLAPLALMSYADVRAGQLVRLHLDGVPLDLAAALLPGRTRLKWPLLVHLHWHARAQAKYADRPEAKAAAGRRLGQQALLGLLDSLRGAVRGLRWEPEGTPWAEYAEEHSYSEQALQEKQRIVGQCLDEVQPQTVWDLGANVGVFSRLAAERGAQTIAFDLDPAAVDRNYRSCLERKETRILPLVMDLSNPSPSLGWAHRERDSLIARGPADAALALALVHHLAIGNNVPLPMIAAFLGEICTHLIVEFVPKGDSQVQRLLASREDVFSEYTPQHFETAFAECFTIRSCHAITDSDRVIYLMEKR